MDLTGSQRQAGAGAARTAAAAGVPPTQSFDFSRTNQRAALAEHARALRTVEQHALEARMTSGNADTQQHQQHVNPPAVISSKAGALLELSLLELQRREPTRCVVEVRGVPTEVERHGIPHI